MPSITYRLKASNHIGTIDIPGSLISCKDAEESIAEKLKLPLEEIQIFLSGSTSLLHPEENILANAVVDVVRHVGSGKVAFKAKAYSSPEYQPAAAPLQDAVPSANLTEEERLAQLQAEVTLDTGIEEGRGRGRGRGGWGGRGRGSLNSQPRVLREDSLKAPPKGYICHNCGKGGHLIQHCPAARSGSAVKVLSMPIGIPESMLEQCSMDDPAPKFITRDNRIVKRKILHSAFAGVANLVNSTPTESKSLKRVRENEGDEGDSVNNKQHSEFLCLKCGKIAVEAMKTGCCHRLFCSECFHSIADEALQNESFSPESLRCPHCNEVLLMDEVEEAHEEREKISKLASA